MIKFDKFCNILIYLHCMYYYTCEHLKCNKSHCQKKKLATDFQVDLTKGDFNELIGFDKKIVTASEYGKRLRNITNSIDTIRVNCDSMPHTRHEQWRHLSFQHEWIISIVSLCPKAVAHPFWKSKQEKNRRNPQS